MKHRLLIKMICMCLGVSAGFLTKTPVSAEENQVYEAELNAESGEVQKITVTAEQIEASSPYRAIQNALNAAEDYEGTTEITVEPGTYTLSYGLDIYSNTTLHLEGVTLVRNRDINMLHVGGYENVSGYYWHDIKVTGGTFDQNQGTTVCIKAGHASNLTFEGVTLKNSIDAHLLEVAAVENLNVISCTFSDMVLKKTGFYEAIQLDVLAPYHFGSYRAEALACRNVTVKDCVFDKVPRGVGSHTAILNAPMDGITVTDNVFRNLGSAAIQGCNWTNVTISRNQIENSPRGIALFTVNGNGASDSASGAYTASFFDELGGLDSGISNSYKTPTDSHTVISDNTMNLTGKDRYAGYVNTAIRIGGTNYTKQSVDSTDESGAIPTGNYWFSGAEIRNNTITSPGHGIALNNARNIKITGNTVSCANVASNDSTNYYGVHVYSGSQSVTVDNNTISNVPANGIMVHLNCQADSIRNNVIKSPGYRGICVEASKAAAVNGNTISNAGDFSIYVSKGDGSASAGTIENNVISNSKSCSITVNGASVTSITGNRITGSRYHGVFLINAAKVSRINSNNISLKQGSASDTSGIIAAGSTADTIKNNVVDAAGMCGIIIASGSKTSTLTSNKICNAAGELFWIRSDSGSPATIPSSNRQYKFPDVTKQSEYYYTPVYWAAVNGIAAGYSDGTFGPKLNCTREQMMTFLWRLAGKPEPSSSGNPFPDIHSGDYYYKAVLWGVEKGITNGYSSGAYKGKFGVGLACTREQAMTFLWRMAGKPDPKTSASPFPDVHTSDYYYKAVLWASENSIAKGYTSGAYAGKYGVGLACQREHMVTFLYRYAEKFR